MYNLNKKQKIILAVIEAFIVCVLSYYAYTKDEKALVKTEELQVENQTEEQEETEEEFSDTIIMVHVSGAVNREGLVELKPNSRIADAIDKADGLRDDACIDEINLAYRLEDGMKVYVPTITEVQAKQKNSNNQDNNNVSSNKTGEYVSTDSGTNVESSKDNQDANASSKTTSKININTATQAELETLPGIGPSTALKIINYRTENGKFGSIEEIKEVSGIGDSKYNSIKDLICI